MTADEVLGTLAAIARDPKADNKDRLRALELLGKYHRLFTERGEPDTPPPLPVLTAEQREAMKRDLRLRLGATLVSEATN